MLQTSHVCYTSLNARQKESYNAAKLGGLLADFGYTCVRLHDDYESGDLLALCPGEVHNIQLKGRLSIAKKYEGKGLLLAFPAPGADAASEWYVVPHDLLVALAAEHSNALTSKDWNEKGLYSWPRLSRRWLALLAPYRLASSS
jgi:hypothetical protein